MKLADPILVDGSAFIGPDPLIVLFRPEGGGIRVLHLVLKETIERYFTCKVTTRNRHQVTRV